MAFKVSNTVVINDSGNLEVFATVYANTSVRPANNNVTGTIALISDTKEVFLWTGDEWYGIDTSYTAAPSGPSSPLYGTVSGYTSGGGFPTINNIDKFPFATDGNATDVGDLTRAGYSVAGQSSSENGYTSGGETFTGISNELSNVIDKFPFATDANATDVGDLTQARYDATSQSSDVSGYTSGGNASGRVNTIDKFPFATDANATDVGDLTFARDQAAGQSSSENGYTSGGYGPIISNVIDKFPFATDGNATDVGDLTLTRRTVTGQSSDSNGYTSGGFPASNVIDKFPFATDANATDVGDLTQGRGVPAGQSSSESGYTSGGSSPANSNVIDKFPFATDANATDVGDLTVARGYPAGQQD